MRQSPKAIKSLAHEGLLRVIEGITSLTEVARSVDLTGRYG